MTATVPTCVVAFTLYREDAVVHIATHALKMSCPKKMVAGDQPGVEDVWIEKKLNERIVTMVNNTSKN